MNFPRPQPFLLLVILAVLYMTALGSVSLWDVDETRNATAAEEMMTRGDLVIPTVNGTVRAHKPPLHYWFMILAYKLFGVGEFSARFFQAFFGLATVLMVFTAGSTILGNTAGLFSGAVLGVSFMFTVAARSATTDTFLIFFTNAAILAGFLASRKKIWAVVSWAAMGFAVLAKGPVGVVLPLGALVLFRLIDRRGTRGVKGFQELFPPAGILLFIVIAAPWYFLAAARTGGDLITVFILKHNVGRFLKPMESHSGPFFYYLLILLAGFYPWSVFLPQAVAHGLRSARFSGRFPGFLRLQVVWASVVLVFFSIARTKLPNYILPSFPALALLTGAWIESVGRTPGTGFRGRSVSWMVNLVPGLFFPVVLFVLFKVRTPDHVALAWLAVPMTAGAVLGIVLHFKGRSPLGAFQTAAYAAAVGVFCIHVILLPRLEPLRMSPRLGKAIASAAGVGDRVAVLGYDRPALYFYGKRPVVKVREPDEVMSFLSSPEGRFIVATAERFNQLPSELKDRLKVLDRGPDVLDSDKVVLVAQRIGNPLPVADHPGGTNLSPEN